MAQPKRLSIYSVFTPVFLTRKLYQCPTTMHTIRPAQQASMPMHGISVGRLDCHRLNRDDLIFPLLFIAPRLTRALMQNAGIHYYCIRYTYRIFGISSTTSDIGHYCRKGYQKGKGGRRDEVTRADGR